MQSGSGDLARKRASGPTGTAAASILASLVVLAMASAAIAADADELIREGVALRSPHSVTDRGLLWPAALSALHEGH